LSIDKAVYLCECFNGGNLAVLSMYMFNKMSNDSTKERSKKYISCWSL